MVFRALCPALLAATIACPAFAQGDPGQGTGPLPLNIAPNPTPLCTDRPTRATVACTVPEGDFQVESDLINWTRMNSEGTKTDTILYTNPTLKYGITKRTDIELNVAPYETVRTQTAGQAETIGGVGDVFVRVKQRLTADQSKTQVSLIPFIKAPTARDGIGNGKVEGGVASAINIPLPAKFTLTVGPELDVTANDEGSGYHVSLINFINISHGVGKKVNLFAEFWNEQNFDPAGTERQYSADLAASYQISSLFQIDMGINIGLNNQTPSHQLYIGASTRF
jgi:hypothetical protein